MSASVVNISEVQQLREEIAELRLKVESLSGAATVASVAVAVKVSKEKKEKKERKKSGPRAWSDFTKQVGTMPEFLEWRKENPTGLVPVFASEYRKANESKWEEFKAAWELAHPKTASSASSVASVSSETESVAGEKKERKKREPLSEEARKAMGEKRKLTIAAKKAEAAGEEEAAVPVAVEATEKKERKKREPLSEEAKKVMSEKNRATREAKKAAALTTVTEASPLQTAPSVELPLVDSEEESDGQDEEEGAELLPFILGSFKYLRPGNLREGKTVWASGDLWESKRGAKGDWVGVYNPETEEIDSSAEEPEME